MGGIGPMFGQLGFFAIRSTEKSALAIERFTEECGRLLNVMERRLQESPYLAGDDYTIADVDLVSLDPRRDDVSQAGARPD